MNGRQRRAAGLPDPVGGFSKPPSGHPQQGTFFNVKPTAQHRWPRGYTPERQAQVRKENVGTMPSAPHPQNPIARTPRFEDMPRSDQHIIEQHVRQGSGTTMTRAVSRLDRMYMAQSDEHRREGAEWYPQGHRVLTSAGRHLGVSSRTMAGMTAAMSPNTQWSHPDPRTGNTYYDNMAKAVRIGETLHEDPHIHITPEHAAKIRSAQKFDASGKPMYDKEGKPLKARSYSSAARGGSSVLDLENYHGEEAQHHGKSFVGVHRLSELPADVVTALNSHKIGINWRTMNPIAVKKAVRIHRGEDPEHVLEGSKERNFFNNLNHPFEPSSVTVDRHAMRTATGSLLAGKGEYERTKTISKKEMTTGGASPEMQGRGAQNAAYPFFQRAYQLAAHRHGLAVAGHEQAVDWGGQMRGVVSGGYTTGTEAERMEARGKATHEALRRSAFGGPEPAPQIKGRSVTPKSYRGVTGEQQALFSDRRKRGRKKA